jgi:hypothetical protein
MNDTDTTTGTTQTGGTNDGGTPTTSGKDPEVPVSPN